jgi:hypothetical protein
MKELNQNDLYAVLKKHGGWIGAYKHGTLTVNALKYPHLFTVTPPQSFGLVMIILGSTRKK